MVGQVRISYSDASSLALSWTDDLGDHEFVDPFKSDVVQATSDLFGGAGDRQVVDEVIGHGLVGGDGEPCVGEHALVEGQPGVDREGGADGVRRGFRTTQPVPVGRRARRLGRP